MAYALVDSAAGSPIGAGETTVSDPITTTGANLIVVLVSFLFEGGRDYTLSDTYGNTYTKLTLSKVFGNVGTQIAYCASPTVGVGHVVTLDRDPPLSFAPFAGMTVAAFSGATATPFNAESGDDQISVTSIQPGALTPTAGSLVVAVWGCYNRATVTSINSGFTGLEHVTANFGFHNINHYSYASVATGASVNPTVSWTGAETVAIAMASFVPEPAPTPTMRTYATRRMRIFPLPTSETNKRLTIRNLELLLQVGGATLSGQGADPQVMVSISRDYGQTWGPERWVSAGLRGQYNRRAILWNLGQIRSGGYIKIVVSDPIPWTFIQAMADIKEGSS